MSAYAIETKGVTKTFYAGKNAIPVLRGVDFQAEVGEIVMLVGPSGCGKTTFLSVICGTMSRDQGQVRVLDHDLAKMRTGAITRFRGENIGFVFQQFNLIPTLTILENVSIPLLLSGRSTQNANKRAAEVLENVGLGKRTKAFVREMSGGQQQRVAIARALINNPKLLICDEPTASLDATTGQSIMQLFRELARQPGRTVIIVTHDNRIYPYADRIVEMEDGAIKAEINRAEIENLRPTHD